MRDIIQRFYWSKHKDLKLSLMDDRIRKKMRPYDRKYDENVEPSEVTYFMIFIIHLLWINFML